MARRGLVLATLLALGGAGCMSARGKPGERAQSRFWEFFVNNIRNAHTRRAYGRSIGEFLAWCEQAGLRDRVELVLADERGLHLPPAGS